MTTVSASIGESASDPAIGRRLAADLLAATSRTGGLPDKVEDGRTGYLV